VQINLVPLFLNNFRKFVTDDEE